MIELTHDLAERLRDELSQLRHQTRAERELLCALMATRVPSELVEDVADALRDATPTPAERELIALLS